MLEIPLARPCPRYAPDEYQETLCAPDLPALAIEVPALYTLLC